MSAKKFSGAGSDTKGSISVILGQTLYAKIQDAMARRGDNLSRVVRELLERGLNSEQEQQASSGEARPTSHADKEQPGMTLKLRLTPELRSCLDVAAELYGLEPATLVQLMIAENIETLIAKGEEKREELRRLSEGKQHLESNPEGA